jgi:hypothetical protein
MRGAVLAATLLVLAVPPSAGARPLADDSAPAGKGSPGATLHVYPTVVKPGEAPRATLVNTGDMALVSGYGYTLERRTSAGWRWINRHQGVILVLLFLEPGESTRLEPVGIYRPAPRRQRCNGSGCVCIRMPLRPGLYRVTKGFGLARKPDADWRLARATFRVLPENRILQRPV